MTRLVFIILFLCFRLYSSAQDLEFSAGYNTRAKLKVNKDYHEKLVSKNLDDLAGYLDKNPKAINDFTAQLIVDGSYAKTGKFIPAIHEALEGALSGSLSPVVFRLLLDRGANFNAAFESKNVLYRLLDVYATTPYSKCGVADSLFYYLGKAKGFKYTTSFGAYPPALQYLLTQNRNFLRGTYNKDYLSEDLIYHFLDQGFEISTYDEEGNTLISYAIEAKNLRLQKDLISRGASMNVINKQGADAMSLALRSGNVASVNQLIESGYSLSPENIYSRNLLSEIKDRDSEVGKVVNTKAFSLIKSFEGLLLYMQLFPESNRKVLGDASKMKMIPNDTRLEVFLDRLANENMVYTPDEQKKVNSLKARLLNISQNLAVFLQKASKYSLIKLQNYNADYYAEDASTKLLTDEINKLDNTIVQASLKQRLISEINSKREKAKSLMVDFAKFAAANADDYHQMFRIEFDIPAGIDYINIGEQLSGYVRSLKKEQLTLLSVYTTTLVPQIYGFGMSRGKGVLCGQWYRAGTMPDGSFLIINSGFSAFDDHVTNFLQQRGMSGVSAKYLGSMSDDRAEYATRQRVRDENCANCIVDRKKTKWPSDDGRSRKSGKLIMQNGDKYDWDYDSKRWMIVGWFINDYFDTWDAMIEYVERECKRRYCK